MSYSPVCKFQKKKSNNESFLEDVRNIIDKEYRKAVQFDDWSNYNFVNNAYYNYKINGGNSYYIETIVRKYKSQYEKQQNQEIEELQKFCIKDLISATYDYETVTAETAGKKLVEFNRQVYDTYMSPMVKAIEGAEPDCCNVAETKSKSFEEMSKEEKIEFVNKQIDDLLNFIEINKQAKYNKWRKEIGI